MILHPPPQSLLLSRSFQQRLPQEISHFLIPPIWKLPKPDPSARFQSLSAFFVTPPTPNTPLRPPTNCSGCPECSSAQPEHRLEATRINDQSIFYYSAISSAADRLQEAESLSWLLRTCRFREHNFLHRLHTPPPPPRKLSQSSLFSFPEARGARCDEAAAAC